MNERTHTAEHEARLIELCAAEDPRQELERSGLLNCPQCLQASEELLADLALLEGAGATERAAISHEESFAGVERRIESALRESMELEAKESLLAVGPRRSRSGTRWLALAAAAVLLLLVWWMIPSAPDRGYDDPTTLGASQSMQPQGEVDSFGRFAWNFAKPANGHFEVRIFDGTRSDASSPLVTSPALTSQTWELPPGTTLPERVRWQLVIQDGSHDPPVYEVWATRRSGSP